MQSWLNSQLNGTHNMNFSELSDNTGRVNFGHIYEENKNVASIRRSSFTYEAMSDMVELTLLRVIPLRFVFKKTHDTAEKMVVGNGIFTVLARFIENQFTLRGKYFPDLAGKFVKSAQDNLYDGTVNYLCCKDNWGSILWLQPEFETLERAKLFIEEYKKFLKRKYENQKAKYYY